MIRKQSVKASRLSAYEKATVTGLRFEVKGDEFKSLTIETSIGPLELYLESYSVRMCEAATSKVYRATVTDDHDVFPPLQKDFEDKTDRDSFVSNFDTNDGRFQIAVSEFEQQAA